MFLCFYKLSLHGKPTPHPGLGLDLDLDECNRFNCMESVESMGCWLPGSWCLLVITPMGLDVIQSIQLYGIDGDPCLWLGYDA
jgi:hypothetical protein